MKLTIRKKLIASFLIIAAFLAITNTISFISIQQIDHSYNELLNQRMAVMLTYKEIQLNASQINNELRDYLLTNDLKNLRNIETIYYDLNNMIVATTEKVQLDEHKEKLAQMKQLNDDVYKQIVTFINTKKQFTLDFANQNLISPSRNLGDIANELAREQKESVDEASMANTEIVNAVNLTITMISVIATILAIVIGYFISRVISKPMIMMTKAAEHIADGDLTIDEIKVKNRDEIGHLANSFNHMVQNLRNLIDQVRTSAEQVAASSEQLNASTIQTSAATEHIATSIGQIASGTDQQVQSVEETSHGFNEMSKGVQQISDNAQSVYNTAIGATERAVNGNRTIQTAVKQMNSIHSSIDGLSKVITGLSEQSNQIGQIVQVISDIAAQTNLLALNAAIEAARAGEQGRGFAVVADEVRKLAEQSAGSAEQISLLIGAIQGETNKAMHSMDTATEEVSEGISLVHSAGEAFADIQNSIDDVSKQIGDVSASVQQISAATEQMVHSIEMISKIAEESAASTQNVSSATEEQLASMEEISTSAHSLSQMAEDLQLLISKFKI